MQEQITRDVFIQEGGGGTARVLTSSGKKLGTRWSSSGEHIVIRMRWSRFKSFRPVVSLQKKNLLHTNPPFQDLLMVTAGVSTESCSVAGKP